MDKLKEAERTLNVAEGKRGGDSLLFWAPLVI